MSQISSNSVQQFGSSQEVVLRQRKQKNINEGFGNLHITLLICVYALTKICQVK